MQRIFLYIYILFTCFAFTQSAMASTGSIVPGFHNTKVCHDSTCTVPTPGILNFRPTGATAVVVDDVTGLSGDVWGNELGWITLNPTGEGVTFADTTTGLLTGKAWSQVSGWINFAPTGQTVTISPTTGQFSGYAWTGGPQGGWVKFDCASNDTCVKTTWSPTTGGGGGGGSYIDVCTNIPGFQMTIPPGYTVYQNGQCVLIIDVCPNLAGDQQVIPFGFTKNGIGACIPNIDYCPNITGIQNSIPKGYSLTLSGNCVSIIIDACPDIIGIQTNLSECGVISTDVCTNIIGIQLQIPVGYQSSDKQCFPQTLDVCKNIEGNQFSIPTKTIITKNGECIPEPEDYCSNLAGYQSGVPFGFYEKGGICLFDDPYATISLLPEEEEIVAFSFISKSSQIITNNSFIKKAVKILGFNKTDFFRVDLVSATIYTFSLILFMYLLFLITRKAIRQLTRN